MTDFDTKFRQSLSEEDNAFLDDLEQGRGLFTQMGDLFQGPMRQISAMVFVLTFVATGVALFATWKMFQTDTTRPLILWTAGAWAAWTVQIQLKVWLHNRMNTLNILREIKRLELRVAQLDDRMS